MKNKIIWIITILNMILTAIVLGLVESDQIPVHFNIAGEADRIGYKWFYMFFALIPLLLTLFFHIYRIKTLDNPKIKKNRKLEDLFIPIIIIMMILIEWATLLYSIFYEEHKINTVFSFISLIFSIFFLLFGNFTSKIKPNRTFGLRVPWTLKDETVWKKAHRLCGYTCVAGGFLMLIISIISFFLNEPYVSFIGLMAGVIVGILPPTIYSWRLYHKIHDTK